MITRLFPALNQTELNLPAAAAAVIGRRQQRTVAVLLLDDMASQHIDSREITRLIESKRPPA
jgi:hypothetical protein